MLRQLRKRIKQGLGREYRIRYRLLKASVSPTAILARYRTGTVVVSYPKCGRTWMRLMVSQALALRFGIEDVDYLADDVLGSVANSSPRIRFSHDDSPQWKPANRLETSKRRYRRKNVVLLARDPRDTVVSMYFERTRREQAYSKSLHEFLREPKGSIDTIIRYYNIWAHERSVPRQLCLVRYEELRAEPANQLRRILNFVGVDNVRDEHIDEAVRFSSFDNMRKMERDDELGSGRLRARDKNDEESYKTRRGKVGGYADYLSRENILWLDDRLTQKLDPYYGYGPTPRKSIPSSNAASVPVGSLPDSRTR